MIKATWAIKIFLGETGYGLIIFFIDICPIIGYIIDWPVGQYIFNVKLI